jgi:hypothetical protein
MPCIIVTEGPTDQTIIEQLLRPEFEPGGGDYQIAVAGGRSAADSLARSYLMVRPDPVALFVDADTSDPDAVEERRLFLNESLGQVATSDRFRVILAVPEVEALLFSDRPLLEAMAGQEVGEGLWTEGKFRPREVLRSLIQHDLRNVLMQPLPQHDLTEARKDEAAVQLRSFVAEARHRQTAAA